MGSIQTEITRIANAKTAIRTAINNKGGTVSDTALIDTYASAINNLSTGGGTFAYAVVECDESFSSELESNYGEIVVPVLVNFSGLILTFATTEVRTNHSFSKIDTFENLTFEDYKSIDFVETYKLTISEYTPTPDDDRLFINKSIISTYKNDPEKGWLLISGTDFIPKPNHFYTIEIKKGIIQ